MNSLEESIRRIEERVISLDLMAKDVLPWHAARTKQALQFIGGALWGRQPSTPPVTTTCCANPVPRILSTNQNSSVGTSPIQLTWDASLGWWRGDFAVVTPNWSLPGSPCTTQPGTTTVWKGLEFRCDVNPDSEDEQLYTWFHRYSDKRCNGLTLPWIQNSPGDYNFSASWVYPFFSRTCTPKLDIIFSSGLRVYAP